MKKLSYIVTLSLSLFVIPSVQAAEFVQFVSCPVYRDTQNGRKSGCWLADNPETGIRYDVTQSASKPDWNYAVLVEGLTAEGDEQLCGGQVLEPVKTSILFGESCPAHMLPAEGFEGRFFTLPPRTVAPLAVPRRDLEGPFEDKTFHLFFDYNQDFIIYQYTDFLLDQAITWIRAAQPQHFTITGFADTERRTISGRVLSERPGIAQDRAEMIKEALLRVGIREDQINLEFNTNPQPVDVEGADGILSASRRRVDIRAEF